MAGKPDISDSIDKFERLLNSGDEGISLDPENLVEQIDMDEIDSESTDAAVDIVSNLSKIYFDDKFMDENPGLKKRIDSFIESMRILIKMRKSSERTHDILVSAIPSQPTNASLYRSQAQIESNLLSIQKQMDETISSMTNLLKGYQLELNFRENENSEQGEDTVEKDIHRGSKTFIQQMQQKNSSEQLDLFTGSGKVDDFTGEPEEE